MWSACQWVASTPVSRKPVGVEHLDELLDAVRGVDRNGLARLAVADEVHEVDHLPRDRIVTREVAPGEELAEVQTLAHRRSNATLIAPVSAFTG